MPRSSMAYAPVVQRPTRYLQQAPLAAPGYASHYGAYPPSYGFGPRDGGAQTFAEVARSVDQTFADAQFADAQTLARPPSPRKTPTPLKSWGSKKMDLPVKNTFIEFPNMQTPPIGTARCVQSCPPAAVDKENAGNLPLAVTPPFVPLKDCEEGCALGCRSGCASAGSVHHPNDCKPCAWYHHSRGCQRGSDCEFCHLCPPGEIKRRKKEKYRVLRESKDD